MRIVGSRWVWRVRWGLSVVATLLLAVQLRAAATDSLHLNLSPNPPGAFDPTRDLRDAKPLPFFAADSIAGFNVDGILYQVETEFDSTTGYYIITRSLLGSPYARPRVWEKEAYRNWRLGVERQRALSRKLRDAIYTPPERGGSGALEIQVPFKIRSRTFRRIFGGDRVGLRVSGNIKIDGGLRREKSDQVQTRRSDQANYNFQIDQSQRFHIVGKVGDKVSVEIDQDSERLFDFENNVKLTYEGYEDEIIQSIEAGNVTLDLAGTQLATLTARNQGLFGFKTVSQVGPLSVTTIASLQKGEKNKQTYTGGSQETTYSFKDINPVEDQYFFLDEEYRENYRHFTEQYAHVADPNRRITKIKVFRSITRNTQDENIYTGYAFYDDALPLKVPDMGGATRQQIADTIEFYNNQDELTTAEYGIFELLEDGDYEYNPDLGYIRLARPANDEIVAVAYEYGSTTRQTVGTLYTDGTQLILKMLRSRSPKASDPNRKLGWRNVYSLGTGSVKYSNLDLRMLRSDQNVETTPEGKSWLEVFGLDRMSNDGSLAPDGDIDSIWVNSTYAEIKFPDLRPFDPEGYYVGSTEVTSGVDTLRNPDIYNELRESTPNIESYFKFQATYSSTSGDINLGINVLEGSEEVYANGRKLEKDVDYTIDYLSGRIVILDQTVLNQGSQLEIKYESGELFQLDKRTMFGIRLEYALWEESFVGATFLHFNETPIERRVKVGNEPLRNTIWDLNTRLKFRPYVMTRMVNALPMIDTDAPSTLSIEGEIAQVFPNPNSLNNDATGDKNGVAYVDDFEAARRTTSLGVRRRGWTAASHPFRLPYGDSRSVFDDLDYRGRLIWYNPYNQIPIKDIWPNREINSQVANSTDILVMQYDPTVNNFRTNAAEPRSTWNGVMRWMNTGYQNQTTTRFIEVWMKWDGGGGENAAIYFDLGEISEDVIPNKVLDTEDRETATGAGGNDILDDGEDTGLDGKAGSDPPWRTGEGVTSDPWTVEDQGYDFSSKQYDWWDLDEDGEQSIDEPFSSDNWNYVQGSTDYDRINGTESNANDEVRRPDKEDLDNNLGLDQRNNFYRYRFQLNSDADYVKYVRGGQDNEKGWRLIRIPVDDAFDTVNEPSLSAVKYVRVWFGGATSRMTIQIAQMELVGNEWQESPVVDELTRDTTVYVSGSTINTHDNAEDYVAPPGVEGEIDPVTDLRSKEQSLVVQIHDMPTTAEGELVKYLTYKNQDLREYRLMKMFVHGGGRNVARMADKNLEMFLRFGSGLDNSANRGYYEYSQKLNPGWTGNEIVIDLDRLAALKDKASANRDGDIVYEVLPNGDVMKVVGNPSLGRIQVYAIGVRNLGKPILDDEELEMWVDELRLSEVRKESGLAMRSTVKATFADVMTLNASLIQQDAEFHQVDQRTGRDYSNLNTAFDGQFNLHRFFDPAWQISLPLHGTVKSNLSIPKYTQDNGDIRLSSLENGDISIWKKYGEVALNQDLLEDRYLLDDDGQPVVDSTSGLLRQDPAKWGVDSLLSVNQTYSWGINFNKGGKSGNWLLRYLLDPVTWSVSHSQKYSSSIRTQYSKTFNSNGKVNYSLNFQPEGFEVFSWAENVPVLKSISTAKFNPLPSNLNANVNVTQNRGSTKNRNARELPKYNTSMTRGFSTGFSPFRPFRFDYSINYSAEEIRADSTQQKIIFDDQPSDVRDLYWFPSTLTTTILESTLDSLDHNAEFLPDGPELVDEAEQRRYDGESPADVLAWLFDRIDTLFPLNTLKRPWQRYEAGSAEFNDRFFQLFGKTFAQTSKNQSVSASVNPQLVNWLSTSLSYRSNYNWNWSKIYAGRRMSTSNSLNGSLSFRLRQILPAPRGGKPARSPGKGRQLPKGGVPEPQEKPQEGEKETAQPSPAELLHLLLAGMRKMQDIKLSYSQSIGYSDPLVLNGSASLPYQLGLTGDPGVGKVSGEQAVGIDQVTRTDDYRISSGVDWSTRVNSSLDYSYRTSRNHNNQVSGSIQRSQFFWYNTNNQAISSIDLPNYTVRWSGIEQFGPLSNFAQSITLNHTYRGSMTERWEERAVTTGKPVSRVVSGRAYDKGFTPLAGISMTWKYGIGSQINYNWNQNLDENVENGKLNRSSSRKITFSASYTRKSGFRIPLPIWPFKNRRFNNETIFSLDYEQSLTLDEVKFAESSDFEETKRSSSWSLQPKVNYKFSRTVTGAIHYRYGVNVSPTNTTRFQEFGVNVNIQIRG